VWGRGVLLQNSEMELREDKQCWWFSSNAKLNRHPHQLLIVAPLAELHAKARWPSGLLVQHKLSLYQLGRAREEERQHDWKPCSHST
jgi:hypothetical protein